MADAFLPQTIEDNVTFRKLISGEINVITEDMLEGLTEIRDYAFYHCDYLKIIGLPHSITKIGNYSFYNVGVGYMSSDFFDLKIPNGVTTIGEFAFRNAHIKSVVIPISTTNIGRMAFYWCSQLSSVTVEATTPPTIGSGVFSNAHSSLVIYVPAASVETYKSAANWSQYADKIQAIVE
jgi:hypothetical protein